MAARLTVVQMLPALDGGGVEKGTLEAARYLVTQGHRSLVISGGGRMVAQLQREGSEHIAWTVGAKRLGTLRYIKRVREILRKERPDILHLRSRLPAWIGYWAWRGLNPATRPHLVTTVHGPYTPGWYSSVMVRGERVIAISDMIRAYILKNYPRVDAAIIRVIPRGVDPREYPHGYRPSPAWLTAWRALYPQLEGKYVVTLPARLTRWKGQEDFIALIAGLKRRGLPVHGLVVGDAHPRKQAYAAELQRQVAQAGLAAGLQERLFQPGSESRKDFYAELPIKMQLTGGYHEFGLFVSSIAALPRIVTLHDIEITRGGLRTSSARGGRAPPPSDVLTLNLTAKTYRYLDEAELAAGVPDTSKKSTKSKRKST